MKNFLIKYKFALFLFLITLILFLINYKSGTYLSGWDNLQTELNPGLAVKRAFFSVWEEYQSFGLTAGMAHAADLPRAVFLWFASFVIPQNMIRYFYHFLMLLIGGLGMMKLINKQPHTGSDTPGVQFGSFLGALFYMLNLGTVQIFYVPFESFSTFFAFLPWGIWIFKKILNIKYQISKRDVLIFFLINLLGTPAFYTQQLFVVYLLVLGCIALSSLFGHPKGVQARKIFLSFLLILIINSFWILPQIYFLKTNGDWVTQSKANQIATEDTLYQNLEKGMFNNFLRLEGFYFDLKGIHNIPLFAPWKDHFSGIFRIVPYVFAGLAILGFLFVILSVAKDLTKCKTLLDSSTLLGMTLILLLCALALLSATVPFSWLNSLIRQNSFINQIFRSPFTKFIIPFSLVYSYFVTKGIKSLDSRLRGNDKRRNLFLVSCFLIIFFYSLPSFQGYFISPEMKVKIPSDYFQIMDYFRLVDKNKRIALLPDYTFWGWFFAKWGYNGSGFLWYGIEQPIVSRTFDVWSPKSESYYWEINRAINSENRSLFQTILNKYAVDYLLLDKSLLPVVSSFKAMQIDRIENLLNQLPSIRIIKKTKYLTLYSVKRTIPSNNFISLAGKLPNIGPKIKITNLDSAFLENNFYQTDTNKKYNVYYPYLDLTNQTFLTDTNWQIKEENNQFILTAKLPPKKNLNWFNNYNFTEEFILFVNNQLKNFKVDITNLINDQELKTFINAQPIINVDVKKTKVEKCFTKTQCFAYFIPYLENRYGYLVKVINKNIRGRRLFFYIQDYTKKGVLLETRLKNDIEYFIIPTYFQYAIGYNFVFHNNSYENLISENKLVELTIYPLPEDYLKKLKFVSSKEQPFNLKHYPFKATKKTYSLYLIENLSNSQNKTLILNQSYDNGWQAYFVEKDNFLTRLLPFIFGKKIKNHVLVNNWANGWIISKELVKNGQSSLKIVILFWPQYLQFLGFGLILVTLLRILLIKES